MKPCLIFCALFSLCVATLPGQGREVAGVELPERVVADPGGQPLVLNGAGVVRYLFSRIMVGALYLPRRQRDADGVIRLPGARRVVMHILYDEISAADLGRVWKGCIAKNLTSDEGASVRPKLDQLQAMLGDVRRGDVVEMDFLPGIGTRVRVNDHYRGTVGGEATARAILSVWLGEEPADRSLKLAMLGQL